MRSEGNSGPVESRANPRGLNAHRTPSPRELVKRQTDSGDLQVPRGCLRLLTLDKAGRGGGGAEGRTQHEASI